MSRECQFCYYFPASSVVCFRTLDEVKFNTNADKCIYYRYYRDKKNNKKEK